MVREAEPQAAAGRATTGRWTQLGRDADRRRQRRRRARQHHRDPVPLEEVDGARGGARTRRPTAREHRRRATRASTTRSPGEAVAAPRQGVSRPQGHTRRTDEDARPRPARRRRTRRGRVPRLGHRRALRGAPARAADRGGPAARAAPARPRRAGAAGGWSPRASCSSLGCVIGLAGRLLARDAPGLLRRRRRIPRATSSPSTTGLPYDLPLGIQPLLAGPPLGRHAPERARQPPRDVHRPQAALQGRRREPRARSWSRDASASERAQPRADGADPGVAAADRRVRRDLHPAQRRSSRTSR